MNLMIAATLAWVTFGLLVPRFGRRQQMAVYGLAVAMVLVYFLFPARYMT
jgi:hypothetical protein